MGSPVSPVVADIYMSDFEERALESFDHHINFWRRYIDDICSALPEDRVHDLLSHLNSLEPSISFTVEFEKERTLPFLDLCLTRQEDGSITTSVYRKPTALGQYLHFDSQHPMSMKVGVARTLIRRALDFCTHETDREQELEKIRLDLSRNGYPDHVIRRVENEVKDPTPKEPRLWKGYATVPYVKGVSETIRRILGAFDIRVCFKPINTIRQSLVHPKDIVPLEDKNNVVYKIPCGDCSRVYIGETKRQLKVRRGEHRSAYANGKIDRSAVAEHALCENHDINWSDTTIVDTYAGESGRLLKEAIHTYLQPSTMNREHCGKIPTGWLPALSSLKK